MIVTIQDFISRPYAIPNLDSVEEEFEEFAEEKEREILPVILGPLLYNEFLILNATPPLPSAWDKLVNGDSYLVDTYGYRFEGLKNLLKPYIYFFWVRENNEKLLDSGTVKTKEENAVEVSPRMKLVRAYNSFVKMCGYSPYSIRGYQGSYGTLYGYVAANYSTFPNFLYTGIDKLKFINQWDL